MENPFFPSQSLVCCLADLMMMFGIAAAGLVAAVAALLAQVTA